MAQVTQATYDLVMMEVEKILNKTSDKNIVDLIKWIHEDLKSQ